MCGSPRVGRGVPAGGIRLPMRPAGSRSWSWRTARRGRRTSVWRATRNGSPPGSRCWSSSTAISALARASPGNGRCHAAAVRRGDPRRLGGLVGRPPVMVPMVGEPGSVAVFSDAENYTVVRAPAADAPRWHNDMAARSLSSLIRYRPAALAARLAMPLLVCIAQADTAASLRLAQQADGSSRNRRHPRAVLAALLHQLPRTVLHQIRLLVRPRSRCRGYRSRGVG
jgi:hypothetical protein